MSRLVQKAWRHTRNTFNSVTIAGGIHPCLFTDNGSQSQNPRVHLEIREVD